MSDVQNKTVNVEPTLEQRANFLTLCLLFLNVATDVMLKTFEYLYSGKKPPETFLIELANEKSNQVNKDELKCLQMIQNGQKQLRELDISILFKLIQLTCGLEAKSGARDSVWSKNCPDEKKESLEHSLYKLKEMRNKIFHEFRSISFLTTKNINNFKETTEKLLTSIISEVGRKVEIAQPEVLIWQTQMTEDMKRLGSSPNSFIAPSSEPPKEQPSSKRASIPRPPPPIERPETKFWRNHLSSSYLKWDEKQLVKFAQAYFGQ